MICMLLAVGLMWTAWPEQASADGGSIMVNGVNILQAADHTVPCGGGSAAYDEGTNTLILRNAGIGSDHGGSALTYGVEIRKEGVTVRLEGNNTIDAYLGIWSSSPLAIQGADGGSLAIRVSKNQGLSVPCSGISVDHGGLTVRDANIRIAMENLGDMSGYGIDICGGDNVIVNSQIEITGPVFASENQSVVGINGTGANSLTISNQSRVAMPAIGRGADVSGTLTLSDSVMEIGSTEQSGISAGNVEIVNARLTASDSGGLALHANEKITIVNSEANVKSTGTNALLCGNLEVAANSSLTASGYWPALFVSQNTVIRDASVYAESDADVGIFNQGGNLEIAGSTVEAVSKKGSGGILTKGDLTVSDSDIISSGNAGGFSIKATGNVSVTGGTTELGAGSITADGAMQIGGVITANGTISFDNIHAGSGSVTFTGADYGPVDAAIAEAQDLKREEYKNFEIVDAAIAAVVRGKDIREQAVVDGYAEAVRAAVATLEPVSPVPVIEGANQTAVIGESGGIVIRADWAFDKFVSVLVDGTEIGADCYTVEAGSTIITLKPEYVNTLSPGNHIVGIRFRDGLARATLTLKEKEDPANPPEKPGSSRPENSGTTDNGSDAAPENGQPENTPNPPAEPAQSLSQNLLPGQKIIDQSPHTGDSAPTGWLLVLMAVSAMGMAVGRKRI